MTIDAKWVIGILLALQSLFLGSTFGTLVVTLVYAVIAMISVSARLRRAEPGKEPPGKSGVLLLMRWILQATLFTALASATAFWRVQAYVGEGVNPMVVGVDVIAHSCLFAGWAVWFLRPMTGHVSLLPLGLFVVLLCVAAGGASHSLTGQTTVALTACIGFMLASQAILSVDPTARPVVVDSGNDTVVVRGRRLRIATLLSLLTLSAILMATSGIAKATSDALPGIQNALHEKLKSSLDSVATESVVGGTRYVRGSKLGSIRKHILGDPAEIALRLVSESAPGYLRGHAFDHYEDRRWYSATNLQLENELATRQTANRYVSPNAAGSTTLTRMLRRKLNRFPIHDDHQGTITIETHNDPIKGPYIFTPLGTRWLEASSRQLTITHNGIIQTGVDVTQPYVSGVSRNGPTEPLTGERRNILLQVPEEIRRISEPLTVSLCRNETTATGKADAISQYFQRNFKYSLSGVPVAQRAEPIVFFLETQHPAHCEFFAAATVMLLRSANVPTRYVTGYVAIEASENTEYWVARNRDAHAWVEAYDDSSQRWFPVESTPGRSYQTLDFGDVELGADDGFGSDGEDDQSAGSTWLGQIWGWLMSMRATDPLIIIFRIAQLPLFCVLAFLLWSRYGRSTSPGQHPIDVQSRRMLRQVDRRMRKLSLVRDPNETLHQFANRIEGRLMSESANENREILVAAATWYRQYGNARYRGRLPIPFQQVLVHRLAASEG